MNLKEQILNAEDSVIEPVDIPEWSCTVHVKTLSGIERDRIEAEIHSGDGDNLVNLRAKMAVATVCDEQGNLVFTPDDAAELGNKSASALSKIFNVATRLSGMTEADVDELEKN